MGNKSAKGKKNPTELTQVSVSIPWDEVDRSVIYVGDLLLKSILLILLARDQISTR